MRINFYTKIRIFIGTMFLYALIQAVNNIDTRVGQAQQLQLYVYDSQQTCSNNTAFYGGVEFAKGIILRDNTVGLGFNFNVKLGVNEPLSGALRLAPSTTFFVANFFMPHDLTLNVTSLEAPTTGIGGFVPFIFNITPNPSTLFLTRDITIPAHMGLQIWSNSGGIVDGNNNNIILGGSGQNFGEFRVISNPSAQFNPVPPPITLKNLTVKGFFNQNFTVEDSVIFENVGVLSTASNINATAILSGSMQFRGQNNILGAGGTVFFSGGGSLANFMRIASQSKIYVGPDTTFFMHGVPLNFYFDDSSSQLFLDNCTIKLGGEVNGPQTNFSPGNLTFTAGTLIINGTVTIQPSSLGFCTIFPPVCTTLTARGSTLQLGDGVSRANNCNLIILPGSKLVIDNGITFSNMNV